MTFPDIKTCLQATRSAALPTQLPNSNSGMQNIFLKPSTVPQWLLSSICWVVSCLGGYLGFIKVVSLFSNGALVCFAVFGNAILVCVLMWKRVISTGWQIIGRPSSETLTVKLVENLALVWLALLFAAFAISIGLIAFGIVMCLALAGEPQGGWQ